jgi:hypothetical protein
MKFRRDALENRAAIIGRPVNDCVSDQPRPVSWRKRSLEAAGCCNRIADEGAFRPRSILHADLATLSLGSGFFCRNAAFLPRAGIREPTGGPDLHQSSTAVARSGWVADFPDLRFKESNWRFRPFADLHDTSLCRLREPAKRPFHGR